MARILAHAHTTWSHDGTLTLDEWRGLADDAKCDVVLFAEHEETGWSPARYAEYVASCAAASTPRVRLVPGIEFNQQGFHVLCYGLKHWPERPSAPQQLAAAVHEQGCLLCLAHPVRYSWSYPATLLSAVDAVEVWNSSWTCEGRLGPHPKSLALARGKAMFVGQDVHKPKHVSPLHIVTSSDNVLTDLIAGQYVFRLGERTWTPQQLHERRMAGAIQRCRMTVLRSGLDCYRWARRTAKRRLRR